MSPEQNVLKIVVTGPESSGKTTLATQLAVSLGLPCVPEFARSYVAHLGRPYQQTDLKRITLGQQLWEDWFMQRLLHQPVNQPAMLVCDTDWTVIHVWEQYKYAMASIPLDALPPFTVGPPSPPVKGGDGTHSAARLAYGAKDTTVALPPDKGGQGGATIYLLCAPDMAWQPDSLREHPTERDALFGHYDRLLQSMDANYHVLRGNAAERLQTALRLVRKYC